MAGQSLTAVTLRGSADSGSETQRPKLDDPERAGSPGSSRAEGAPGGLSVELLLPQDGQMGQNLPEGPCVAVMLLQPSPAWGYSSMYTTTDKGRGPFTPAPSARVRPLGLRRCRSRPSPGPRPPCRRIAADSEGRANTLLAEASRHLGIHDAIPCSRSRSATIRLASSSVPKPPTRRPRAPPRSNHGRAGRGVGAAAPPAPPPRAA